MHKSFEVKRVTLQLVKLFKIFFKVEYDINPLVSQFTTSKN